MKRITTTLAASAAVVLAAGSAHGFGGMIAVGMNEAAQVGQVETPFRAEARLETAEQNIDTVIYYKDGHIRDEIRIGGNDLVVLQDIAKKKTYMLMPQGMYMEMEMGQPSDQMKEYRLVEREVVGKETVNGFDTTKYKVVYEGPRGKYGGFTWFTDDNIAVKSFAVSETDGERSRFRYEVKKLERGDQPDSLFVIPPNYRKLSLGGGLGSMMQDMPGMGGQTAEEQPNLAEELGEAAQEGAEEAAKEETEATAKEKVTKGLRKLFGRD
ncbi:MAG: hypothetical protein P8172_16360 [Gammaproteobacteria bacterium]